MWAKNWREEIWAGLDQAWDIVVIGGGITGAGILREAARHGLKVLLVEQRDFAWGTSSRSSKLVHGGLRYLATGQVRLMWDSVRERENLLDGGKGLINPLGFLVLLNEGEHPGRLGYTVALSIYDLMAMQWSHEYLKPDEVRRLAPHVTPENLKEGFRYGDAQTDDARLVLRVLQEGVADGGTAINYVSAEEVICEDGQVTGIRLRDALTGAVKDVRAKAVINATGAWVDKLRKQVNAESRIRPLRGSHLIFPTWKLPMAQAVAFSHPIDGRYVFVFPWEGVTLVGTTDLDHESSLDKEPQISPEEVAYLMAAVEYKFPSRHLTLDDVISTYAGVRPVVGSGEVDPSKETRDHVIWEENGLLTVTGGKLTTFRVIAHEALKAVQHRLTGTLDLSDEIPVLNPIHPEFPPEKIGAATYERLLGRYSIRTAELLAAAQAGELEKIPNTPYLWAELRWAARMEGVVHLDDLLLRRVRLGLLLPEGGQQIMDRIRAVCQAELGWSDEQWTTEEAAYRALWQKHYSLPGRDLIPDWHVQLEQIMEQKTQQEESKLPAKHSTPLVALISLLLMLWWWRRKKVEA